MSESSKGTPAAPWYPVPAVPVLSVEHPCIVQNPGRALRMIGGSREVAQGLEMNSDKPLGLRFRPENPASKPVVSYNMKTNNLLLKFTVPKRTGRKRKRGSDDPFIEHSTDAAPRKDVSHLLQTLRDHPENCRVEPLGAIHSTHTWRTMPDFAYSTRGSFFLNELQAKIFPQRYPLIKQWDFPRTYGLTDTETVPPPVLSTQGLPVNYTYRQNPAVKAVVDPLTGKQTLRNTQAPTKLFTYQVQYGDKEWPVKPNPKCLPLSQLPESHQKMYQLMRDLFEERPIWTRRALMNQFPDDAPFYLARPLIAYLAFSIRSGPWRDTLCRYGVDPRTDRSYRKYQSVLIQLLPRDRDRTGARQEFARRWARSNDRRSHIFTGRQRMPYDGQSWQLCDLQDPLLKSLVDTPDIYIRNECETRYFGWYSNGTMAKIRVALKAKADALTSGEAMDEAALERFLKLPDQWDGLGMKTSNEQLSGPAAGYMPKDAGKKELEWASAYRSLCRTMTGTLPQAGGSGKGRLSKTKQRTRPSFIDNEDSLNLEELDIAAGYGEPEEGDDPLDEQEDEDDENDVEPFNGMDYPASNV
ncbi:uncharacterized protein Z518_00024 [Rhinocladiella mackenziei CBS 650.93]|uniref:Transcription factor IIIC subunit 5 HTH domain-containing protein n=1 Tax=Rhinocladiella mackenziei CBS 650.93 TaxID=1442369 RepID=A0A0D2IZX9_9EURO|nr:uncharacterized protein Z518_00024 [Rhinocladiella mackenziei CBS 650.93]KIX08946.1 hypothetical protein Z518_00024 [Rhinocladiella mackenziei CBS 650.93]